MSATNEAIYRRLIEEGFNKGNLEVADELVATGAIERQRGGGGDGSVTKSGPASAAEAPTWGASPATPRPESKHSPT